MIEGVEPRLAIGFNGAFIQTPREHAVAQAATALTLSPSRKAPELKSPTRISFLFQTSEALQAVAASVGAIGESELDTTSVESKPNVKASDESNPLRDVAKSAKGFNFSKYKIGLLTD